jgi:hypothetical protein
VPGLSLLISAGGTKTFRSTYKFNGTWITRKLGRFVEKKVADAEPDRDKVTLGEARQLVENDRALASNGKDPQQPDQGGNKQTYEAVARLPAGPETRAAEQVGGSRCGVGR